ncbi:MAG: PH domain-containing protein [Candidatus Nanohaloarchaea archaeon]
MKLSKKGMYYRTVSRTGAGILGLAVFFPPAILLFPFILLAGGVYEYLYWQNYEFYFEGDDLKIKSGVITKNELDIPVRRIQDLDTSQNIIHRILEITLVKVKTAGGDTSKASLKYLDEEQAEQVQQKLRELKNRRKQEEQEESPQKIQEESAEKFYDIEDALMTYSLVSGIQGLAILSILGLIGGIGFSAYVATSAVQMIGYALASVVAVALLSGAMLVSSAITAYSRYYDFTVDKRGDTFEYERGLFNKEGGSIPEEKIQKLEITENFLMRYFGYASLKAETAGYTSSEEPGATSTKVLIPLDDRENVYEHAQRLGDLHMDEINDIGHTARKRYFRRYSMISGIGTVISLGLIYIGFHPGLLILPIAGFTAAKKAANKKWMNIGYSLCAKNLVITKGFWNRRTYAVEFFRFQNLMVSESIFQRRWNLASLTVDTAGDKVVNPQIVDLGREKAFQLRDKLHEKFKDSIY